MSGNVAVRPAEPGDAAALAELMCQLGYKTRVDEMATRLRKILDQSSYGTFVAVHNGIVCGMIGTSVQHSYEHNDCGGRILALVVSEKRRGHGVGRALIEAAEKWFTDQNVTRIALNTRFQRERAHEFYEKLGYTKNGYRLVKDLEGLAD